MTRKLRNKKLLPTILIGLLVGGLLLSGAAAEEIESYCWPAGFFYRLGKLKPQAWDRALDEIEARLADLQRHKRGLLVKGEIIGPLSNRNPVYPEVLVLDQSGLVVRVRNLPNLFFGYQGQPTRFNRNTFLVIKKPQLERLESHIRQQFVISGDFYAFSQRYLEALTSDWRNLQILATEERLGGPGQTQPTPRPR